MLAEVLKTLAPLDGERYLDATLGGGGYSRALLDAKRCSVIAIDRDPAAIARAQAWSPSYGHRLKLINRPFAEIEEALAAEGVAAVDGAVFDLGVSSMQLDEAARGFSFRAEGPLSMRMDGGKPDAGDLVNAAEADDLAAIFKAYGEEPRARRIARAIVEERAQAAILTTTQLAAVVARAAPSPPQSRIHPATRAFQALRIFVNDELGQLARALVAAERLLRPAGRLIVVTFHSLEDRIVKRFIADRSGEIAEPSRHAPREAADPATFRPLLRKAQGPSAAEVAVNPRARSAKLRAAVRLDAAARAANLFAFAPRPPILSRRFANWS
jgi:16S rRNA (cytosine1402-N4)-methyltransferase